MKNFSLYIFDLDGTLLDTAPDVHHSINLALSRLGLPLISLEKTKKAIGPAGADNFSRHTLGENAKHRIDELLAVFRTIYWDNCCRMTRPFPGIADLLEEMDGLKRVVASNKSLPYTERILDCLGIKEKFDLILGPENVASPKPKPDMLHAALAHFSLRPHQALMIGDTDNDLLAAKAAGIPDCGVLWGYSAAETLNQLQPVFLINKPLEVLKLRPQTP
ncbi:HAD-IA family hydrolase [candidate division KSB1 bacterium]|nr:HAD-IA family hydrolase [candidate division KSB1 bacterium]